MLDFDSINNILELNDCNFSFKSLLERARNEKKTIKKNCDLIYFKKFDFISFECEKLARNFNSYIEYNDLKYLPIFSVFIFIDIETQKIIFSKSYYVKNNSINNENDFKELTFTHSLIFQKLNFDNYKDKFFEKIKFTDDGFEKKTSKENFRDSEQILNEITKKSQEFNLRDILYLSNIDIEEKEIEHLKISGKIKKAKTDLDLSVYDADLLNTIKLVAEKWEKENL